MVIGNSVTLLNDQGYTFKVFPPEIHTSDEGLKGSADTEAMVLAIETTCGNIFLRTLPCIIWRAAVANRTWLPPLVQRSFPLKQAERE